MPAASALPKRIDGFQLPTRRLGRRRSQQARGPRSQPRFGLPLASLNHGHHAAATRPRNRFAAEEKGLNRQVVQRPEPTCSGKSARSNGPVAGQ
jgi:hypothetical protein